MAEDGETRVSLLSIREQSESHNQAALVSRIAFVGTTTQNLKKKGDLETLFQNFFRKHPPTEDRETASGLLLMLTNSFIAVVEHSSKVIAALMCELAEAPQDEALIDPASIRILVTTEDVPRKHFPLFVARAVALPRKELYESEPEDIEPVVSQVYLSLLTLGDHITAAFERGGDALSKALDGLRTSDVTAPLLPNDDTLSLLISSPELCTLDDFVALFCTEPNVVLDSELVWPPDNSEWFILA
eukprot:a521071_73.p1 GENE.a521071_73~~a521071_73.p1  ORF type:complete len:252 (-),score=107.30 a521071_73:107-838(-)